MLDTSRILAIVEEVVSNNQEAKVQLYVQDWLVTERHLSEFGF